MYEIQVGGVTFESDPQSFDSAFVVEPDGFTGWYESVGVRAETVARQKQHGDFDLPIFRAGRIITIQGTVIASTEFELVRLGQALTGILADGESGALSVQDSAGGAHAKVRLSGTPKFSPHSSGLEADFQVSFFASDPRKYGAVQQFAGSPAKVQHYGNFPAIPKLTVTRRTGSGGYTVSAGSGTVAVTRSLEPGETHVVDLRTGALFVNGVRRLGGIGEFRPWTIPNGAAGVAHSVTGGVDLSVEVVDTYI